MRFQAPRGTNDILPAESHRWIALEQSFRELAGLYGYEELRTPIFEDTELFIRSSGETSDVVSKQMYSFVDKGGRAISLKPEGTAPAIRALIEHNLCPPGTVARLSYITPIFRYERPQMGRYRQAHQVGLELVGSSSPAADAEIIELTVKFYERLGISDVRVLVNSLGRGECRARFREAILAHAESFLKDREVEEQERMSANPLRLLDSKDPVVIAAMSDVPPVTDFLEDDSRARLEQLQSLLQEANVPYQLDPKIVRGLDYYTETVFEVQTERLGAQSALCGGGRYDDLVKQLGGPPTPAVGVAMGIERALLVLESEGKAETAPTVDVFVVTATESAGAVARRMARDLRASGVRAMIDLDGRSLKSQLGRADKSGATWAAILGDDELASERVTLRRLADGVQSQVSWSDLASELKA